jgi:hypothetical protein
VSAAVTSAVAVAERLGVPVREPAVLRESSSVIVLLAPGGLEADGAAIGRALRACHAALRGYGGALVTSARVTGERFAVAEAALHAYGAPLPELFVRARGLQAVAWSGFAAPAGDARARLHARVAWLRSQLG